MLSRDTVELRREVFEAERSHRKKTSEVSEDFGSLTLNNDYWSRTPGSLR